MDPKVVYVSVKVYQALVEEASVFKEFEKADEDLRKWKDKHADTEGSSVWTCEVEGLIVSG